MTEVRTNHPDRKVRPWLAGLLTLLGWGLGLYYAGRTTAAIKLAVLHIAVGVFVAIGILFVSTIVGPVVISQEDLGVAPLIGGQLLNFAVAIGVWWFLRATTDNLPTKSPKLIGYVGILVLPIVVATALAFLIRSFLVQPLHVAGTAMLPTMAQNHIFAVDRSAYGYSRFSFGSLHDVFPAGKLFSRAPEAGDVVAFADEDNGAFVYVMRVVAGPGDEIEIKDGVLSTNGTRVKREYVGRIAVSCGSEKQDAFAYREQLSNGSSFVVVECDGNSGILDNYGSVRVPPQHYFVMGDNRDRALDSRVSSEIGFVHEDTIIGRAILPSAANAAINVIE